LLAGSKSHPALDAMQFIETIRSYFLTSPLLFKFAVGMLMIVYVPSLARLVRLPGMVALLAFGVLLGPYVLGFYSSDNPISKFMSALGALLLMFSAGLDMDIRQVGATMGRSVTFGVVAAVIPMALGTLLGLALGYTPIPAIVIGAVLASHTLVTMPILNRIGVLSFEPVIVGIGATAVSDTLALIVFGLCISIYTTGFSVVTLSVQVIEIALVVPLILFGLSRLGAYLLRHVEDEDGRITLMLGVMAASAVLAEAVGLADIVGAFLAGLAVNRVLESEVSRERMDFLGKALFIPIFFAVTGFLIDPIAFAHGIVDNFLLVCGLVAAPILGKGIAAFGLGRAFGYSTAGNMVLWAMSVPQLAATLAMTVVAYKARDPAGQPLMDEAVFNAVFVLIVATSTFGTAMTERFAPSLLEEGRSVHRR
jgi:Kef-type K+ transport system membrane component KefB